MSIQLRLLRARRVGGIAATVVYLICGGVLSAIAAFVGSMPFWGLSEQGGALSGQGGAQRVWMALPAWLGLVSIPGAIRALAPVDAGPSYESRPLRRVALFVGLFASMVAFWALGVAPEVRFTSVVVAVGNISMLFGSSRNSGLAGLGTLALVSAVIGAASWYALGFLSIPG